MTTRTAFKVLSFFGWMLTVRTTTIYTGTAHNHIVVTINGVQASHFFLFPTCLINLIKHEHSFKILYLYMTCFLTAGIAHLLFKSSGNHYTWRKVTTTVHNIIVGKLWVDHHGEMDIKNHTTGDKCHLKYYAYSYFSSEKPRKVCFLEFN